MISERRRSARHEAWARTVRDFGLHADFVAMAASYFIKDVLKSDS